MTTFTLVHVRSADAYFDRKDERCIVSVRR